MSRRAVGQPDAPGLHERIKQPHRAAGGRSRTDWPVNHPAGERPQLAPPIIDTGVLGWMRKNLFSSWGNGITTVVLVIVAGSILANFLNWAVVNAVWTAPTGQDCRGHGACWALIHEKYRYIFFGSFPYEQQWRPLLAIIAMLAMLILSSDRRNWNARLLWIWGGGSFVTFLLMFGQIHISIGLILFVALGVGGLRMLMRGAIRTPAAVNGWRALAAVGAIGLILPVPGVLPAV